MENQVSINNLKIHYKTFGGGTGSRPILILHGWGSKSDRWEKVGELLAQKNVKVVIPDLPGFGESEKLETAWSVDTYVDFVNAFIETVPDFHGSMYLLGHSFGGAIAVKFSIQYAQRVEKLFLFGAAVVRKKTAKKQLLTKVAKLVKIFSFLPFYSLTKKAFYKWVIGSNDYLKADEVMKETFIKTVSEDLSPKLLFIKVPTVILWGDQDNVTPIEDAHLINKKIENSKLVVITGGDHDAEQKLPELFTLKLLENL